MHRSFLSLPLLLALCGACAPADSVDVDPDGQSTDEANLIPTITFRDDGSVQQSAPLVAGGRVRVKYFQSRLPECRGTYMGTPGWVITGYASLNGAEAQAFDTARLANEDTIRVTTAVELQLPEAGELALWFQVHNRWGCSEYDTRDGANYHFEVRPGEQTAGATLTFRVDGRVEQTGDLVEGETLRVRYEQDRLTDCRGTSAGNAAWNISGHASFNGGPSATFETGVAGPNGTRVAIDANVRLTAAGDLALWFQNTNRWGCSAFDSQDGTNYHFTVRGR